MDSRGGRELRDSACLTGHVSPRLAGKAEGGICTYYTAMFLFTAAATSFPIAAVVCNVVSNGTLQLERFSSVSGGKLLPGFLFMQGESDGLEQRQHVGPGNLYSIGNGSGPLAADDKLQQVAISVSVEFEHCVLSPSE